MQKYIVLTQDTSTISINQLLTSHAFRKAHIKLGSKVSIIYHLIEKAQFDIALKRYLNTHSFYHVDEYLLSKE
jgi:hypothetical protein